jgi:hypothetical protein
MSTTLCGCQRKNAVDGNYLLAEVVIKERELSSYEAAASSKQILGKALVRIRMILGIEFIVWGTL